MHASQRQMQGGQIMIQLLHRTTADDRDGTTERLLQLRQQVDQLRRHDHPVRLPGQLNQRTVEEFLI